MIFTLSITLGILFILLGVSIFINVRLGIIVLKIQDTIEETLDILDERYDSIAKILEIPLYNDSPEIRKIHGDIQKCRDSVLVIAHRLVALDADRDIEVESALEREGDQE